MVICAKKDVGVDYGGTKIAIARGNRDTGRLIGAPTFLDSKKFATNAELTRAIRETLPSENCNVFIGAAGLIEGLIVKNSPNSAINGSVTFARDLKEDGYTVALTNDMAASLSGVVRWGPGKGHACSAVGTYSSGFNFAVFKDGLLISMEAGHIQGAVKTDWLPKSAVAALWQFCFRRPLLDYSTNPLVLMGMTLYNSKYTHGELARFGLKRLSQDDLKTPDGLARALYALALSGDEVEMPERTFRKDELANTTSLFCGCNGLAHLEPLVSGNGAAWMAQRYLLAKPLRDHRILRNVLVEYNKEFKTGIKASDLRHGAIYPALIRRISARHVYQAFKEAQFEQPQCQIHATQVDAISSSIGILASMHMPEVLVCMGSMTNDWQSLFEPAIARIDPNSTGYMQGHYFMHGLKPPLVLRNEIEHLGLVGAVAYGVMQER